MQATIVLSADREDTSAGCGIPNKLLVSVDDDERGLVLACPEGFAPTASFQLNIESLYVGEDRDGPLAAVAWALSALAPPEAVPVLGCICSHACFEDAESRGSVRGSDPGPGPAQYALAIWPAPAARVLVAVIAHSHANAATRWVIRDVEFLRMAASHDGHSGEMPPTVGDLLRERLNTRRFMAIRRGADQLVIDVRAPQNA